MSIDLLYVAYNRREFTEQSFEALLANTDWTLVRRLFIADDASSDGTQDYLANAPLRAPVVRDWNRGPFGGPVAAMNWYLDQPRGDAHAFAKIDNDRVVPPGWLEDMWALLEAYPAVDALGMQPSEDPPAAVGAERGLLYAGHIGGVGLIRRRIFDICRPHANGLYGWSEWQDQHSRVMKAWANPPLRMFGLDQLDVEPWASLTASYIERGWMRPWNHRPLARAYYDWWEPA
jgi:glycosyltransferase involved in cell wall biosynthesis